MANPELQNMVKDALNALYHHPDDSIRMQADRWLQDFQRTIDAWQVCDSLLHDANSNMETLIFCSQTLRSKVQRDFEELPFEAFGPLRDSLYALLRKLYNGPSKVRTQISIAMASLAVHVSAEDWGHGGIVYWLKDEINAHPECLRSFLELLTVLPQEVFSYKIAARPQRRREFEQELISSMETALSLLTACSGLGDLREQVLDSFGSWLRLNHCIPAATLASHPLVLTTLFSLTSDQLLEAAVNVVSELIHYTASGRTGGLSVQMPLIQVLVPHVMGLKEQLRDPSKDEEDVKAIARLFADMGDSYVDLISTGSQESMLIVQSLLELASHPEYDISSMTYNFWHNLQLNLTGRDMYHSYGSESSIELERKRRLQAFHSTYESLVSMVYFGIQYPENYLELSKEDIKEIKQTRQAVQDVLMDSACVLGSEQTLKILFTKLLQTIGSHTNDGTYQWRPVEAGLYCIWSIANSVPIEEAEIMPQVMALLEKLPRQHILLQTACATIGAYSKWIDGASAGLSVLPVIMEMLISGMSLFENSAVAAALAFRNVCIDCGKKLCSSLDSLFLIYNRAINAEGDCKVSDEGVLHIIEGLSMIVSELPANHAKKALELLCLPVVTPLQEIINQGAESMRQVVARHITIHIDRLAKIFRYVNHPEAVADATQKLWPTFKAFFEYRAWDMRTMEALCSACKYSDK